MRSEVAGFTIRVDVRRCVSVHGNDKTVSERLRGTPTEASAGLQDTQSGIVQNVELSQYGKLPYFLFSNLEIDCFFFFFKEVSFDFKF